MMNGKTIVSALCAGLVAVGLMCAGGCECDCSMEPTTNTAAPTGTPSEAQTAKTDADGWKVMFDGKSLEGWKSSEFGGDGAITIKDGQMVFDFGSPLTGVTWKGEFPKLNYEVELDAVRIEGSDFFCGLTFPYKETHCSLILGGWGGSLVGISSIDHMDASENETMKLREFKNGQKYHVRVRVLDDRIQAWLDKDKIVDLKVDGRQIGTRPEVDNSKPLGVAAFTTMAGISNVKMRKVDPSTITLGPPMTDE